MKQNYKAKLKHVSNYPLTCQVALFIFYFFNKNIASFYFEHFLNSHKFGPCSLYLLFIKEWKRNIQGLLLIFQKSSSCTTK